MAGGQSGARVHHFEIEIALGERKDKSGSRIWLEFPLDYWGDIKPLTIGWRINRWARIGRQSQIVYAAKASVTRTVTPEQADQLARLIASVREKLTGSLDTADPDADKLVMLGIEFLGFVPFDLEDYALYGQWVESVSHASDCS